MAMVWITKNAKYFVITFGALVAIGMLFMSPITGQGGTQSTTYIAKVNGEVISLEEFRNELNQYQEQERNNTGVSPDGKQLAQMRKNLLDYKIRTTILNELIDKYGFHASSEEMWDYLENNPDPVVQQDTNFQTNGQYDKAKFLNWLHQENSISNPYVRYMEFRMKQMIIPENQIRTLSRNQFHATHLEMAFDDLQKQRKAKFVYYKVLFDSLPAVDTSISEDAIKAKFDALPDSFYVKEESAQLGYISIPIMPSSNDTAISLDLIKDIRDKIVDGAEFEEMAISYSDDAGSAENGGSLGGPQLKSVWVPKFSEVAFNLEEGQVSEPVLTRFGYHLIRCNKIVEDSVKKVDASHILIKIEATPETVDSLVQELEQVKTEVSKAGDLKALAEKQGLQYATTPSFQKWNFSPMGPNSYISGMHSFAFSSVNENDVVSEVLQNDNAVYLFEKVAHYKPGRHLEPARASIRNIILQERKVEMAKAEVEKALAQIKGLEVESLPVQVGLATKDTTDLIAPQSWVPGVGYDKIAVHKIFNQPVKQWGEPLETDYGAVAAYVLEKQEEKFENLVASTKEKKPTDVQYVVTSLNNKWFTSLMEKAEVENNLDVIYRN